MSQKLLLLTTGNMLTDYCDYCHHHHRPTDQHYQPQLAIITDYQHQFTNPPTAPLTHWPTDSPQPRAPLPPTHCRHHHHLPPSSSWDWVAFFSIKSVLTTNVNTRKFHRNVSVLTRIQHSTYIYSNIKLWKGKNTPVRD